MLCLYKVYKAKIQIYISTIYYDFIITADMSKINLKQNKTQVLLLKDFNRKQFWVGKITHSKICM